MIRTHLKEIGIEIHRFLTDEVETTARRTNFVQRRSKLTGMKFLQAVVFNALEKPRMTLSSIAQSCLDLGVNITAQGIDERLDESSVAFLRTMFERAMERFRLEEPLDIALLEQFSSVYLVDSSQISLPESMAELFPGSGGNASKASMKIHLMFDYLYGHFEHLECTNGCEPDQGYRGHWPLMKADALFVMDLGYFVLDTFKLISAHHGYFLSRFKEQTALLDQGGKRIELEQLLAKQDESVSEYEVAIGCQSRHQIPCRLIVVKLSQEVADRRRQKAKKNAQRHGRTITKARLKLLDWGLFVTNVPSTMLQPEHVFSLYRVRWQIELVFKMCKSYCGLDSISSQRSERILTEFYARLVGIVLIYFLVAPVRLPFGPAYNREISPFQVRSIFQRFTRTLASALGNPEDFVIQLHELFHHISRFGFKQKRRKRPNVNYALALISACYDWNPDNFSSDFMLDVSPVSP